MKKTKIYKLLGLSSAVLSTFFIFTGCTDSDNPKYSYIKEINSDFSNTYEVVTRYLKDIDGLDVIPATDEILFENGHPYRFKLQYKLKDDENTVFTVNVNTDSKYIYDEMDNDYLSSVASSGINEISKKYLPKGSQVFASLRSVNSYKELKEKELDNKSLEEIISSVDYIDIESILVSIPVADETVDIAQYEKDILNLTLELNKTFNREDSYLYVNILMANEDNFLDKMSDKLNIYSERELVNTITKEYLIKNIKSSHLLDSNKRELFSKVIGFTKESITTDKNNELYLDFDINRSMHRF